MSVNKVILIGNVGQDPQVRYLEGGIAVATFSLATTERGYKTQNGAVVPDRTDWHNIVAWRGLAEIIEKYVRKGSSLYIEGKIRTRSWDDQNGVKRYTTEVYVDNMELLNRKGESVHSTESTTHQHQPQQAANNSTGNNTSSGVPTNNKPDDLPF